MEAGAGSSGGSEISLDISFGFDDDKYSDRTLLLEIINDDDSTDDNRNVKRRRSGDYPLITATTELPWKTIRINSLILAARSTFFRKLFSNGMLESEQKNITLRMETSEEASFMDLLKYVYTNNLPTALNALLDLCVIADKFGVASCLRDCVKTLEKLPVTCESACLYLDHPQSLSIIQPLIDKAKKFLFENFKDFHKFDEAILNLSLAGIQAVLSSDDLQVNSESQLFALVLKWVHNHYPNLEERRKILQTHLLHLIRFPFMTVTELTENVQTCNDIDPELASKIVFRALCFKAETLHQKRCLAAEEGNAASRQFVERSSKCRPVKVVELELPYQQCIVYLHFTRANLTPVYPDDHITSETFHLGEHELVLIGRSYISKNKLISYFWLALKVVGSSNYTVNYDIQLMMKPPEEFKSVVKGSHTFTEPNEIRWLQGISWIDDGSTYFINNALHVRAQLRTKK